MIVFYKENGHIYATVFDPLPKGYKEAMEKDKSINFIEVTSDMPLEIDGGTQYVDVVEKVLNNRPTIDLQDEYNINVGESLSINIPESSILIFHDSKFMTETLVECSDGLVELDGEMPDTYEITIQKWPYIDKTIRINVT